MCDMMVKPKTRHLAAFWVMLKWLAKGEKGITNSGKNKNISVVRIWGRACTITQMWVDFWAQVTQLYPLQGGSWRMFYWKECFTVFIYYNCALKPFSRYHKAVPALVGIFCRCFFRCAKDFYISQHCPGAALGEVDLKAPSVIKLLRVLSSQRPFPAVY